MPGNNRRGLILQDRDRNLLRELAVMRVIDREQAKRVAGFGSTPQVNKRLLALTRAGLLRRFFLGTTGGGQKALYALSSAGAEVAQVPFRSPRRTQDKVLVADFFVAHQLSINEIYCAVKYAPIPIPATKLRRWVSFHQPLESGIRLIPDGYFELVTPQKTLGHEGLSVWKAKVRNYLQYAVSGNFEKRFGQPQFRVLVVTDSERRMQSLRAATASLTEKIFWFSTFDSIATHGFWSSVWLRTNKEGRQCLVSPQ